MLRYPTAYDVDTEMSFSLLRRFPRNTNRTTSKSRWTPRYLSFEIPAKHRQDQRGHPRLELARLSACQPWQTTPPSFRMERRTFVYTRCIPYPLIVRQEAILLGYLCLEIRYEIMGVIF